jgi:hypothetical protein
MITRVAFDMRLSDATMSRLAAPSRKLPQGLAERPLNVIMESSEDRTRRKPASEAANRLRSVRVAEVERSRGMRFLFARSTEIHAVPFAINI